MGIVRSALRHLAGAPGFTAVAILSLTLGIGPTTAIFSLIDELLLRTLPVPRPEELVLLRVAARRPRTHEPRRRRAGRRRSGHRPRGRHPALARHLRAPAGDAGARVPHLRVGVVLARQRDCRRRARAGDLGAVRVGRLLRRRRRDGSRRPPDRAGRRRGIGAPVAVLSHRYWQRRFDGRADAIGRTILINKVPATIVGVSAAGFDGTEQVGETVDVSVPLAHFLLFQPDRPGRAKPGYWWLSVMARLAPGATADQLRAALEPAFQAAARDGWVSPEHALADRPDDPRLLVEPGAQGHNETRRAQRDAAAAPPGARRAGARRRVRERLDAAGGAGRCATARLRAAPGDRRQPARHRRPVHRRSAAAVGHGRDRRHRRGVAVARRAARAASVRPQSHRRARSAARRTDPGGDGRRVGAVRPGVRAAAGAAGQPHRSRDGVPGRHADARQPPPIVGGARPARRAGGAVARPADQRRPVLADAQPGSMPSTPASISAACCCSASTPRRRAMPTIASVALHDQIRDRLAGAAGRARRHLLAGGAALAGAAEQVVRAARHRAGQGPAAGQHQRRRAQLLRGDGPADPARPRLRRRRSRRRAEGRGRQRDVRAAAVRRRRSDWPAHRVRRARPACRSPTSSRWSVSRATPNTPTCAAPCRRRLSAGLPARRRRGGVRRAGGRQSRGADAGGAGGVAGHRSDAAGSRSADAARADRAPARERASVRLALDLLRRHRGGAGGGRPARAAVAGGAAADRRVRPAPRGGRDAGQRRRDDRARSRWAGRGRRRRRASAAAALLGAPHRRDAVRRHRDRSADLRRRPRFSSSAWPARRRWSPPAAPAASSRSSPCVRA